MRGRVSPTFGRGLLRKETPRISAVSADASMYSLRWHYPDQVVGSAQFPAPSQPKSSSSPAPLPLTGVNHYKRSVDWGRGRVNPG